MSSILFALDRQVTQPILRVYEGQGWNAPAVFFISNRRLTEGAQTIVSRGEAVLAYTAKCNGCGNRVSIDSTDFSAWKRVDDFDALDPTARDTYYLCPECSSRSRDS